jgi:hypothetical protein
MTTPSAISTTNTSRKIRDLLKHIDRDQLVLPEIQREFVWTKKAVKLLFDSLYRGLPIGHMLVWKADTEVTQRDWARRRVRRRPGQIANFYGYLLDGQQRMTAIGRVRDDDEDYPLMFYAYPDRKEEDWQPEPFYWRGKNEEPDPWCVPVSEILSDDFSVTERIAAIRKNEYFKPHHEELVLRDLAQVQGILDYPVGVIEWTADDYKLATDLFVRFNSTGRKLRPGDLNLAQLAIHVPGLASQGIRRAQSKWAGFKFTPPFLVQCLLAVHTGRMRTKDPERFWSGENPAAVRESWTETDRAFGRLVSFLSGTVRWGRSTLIPSFNALIPLVYVLAKKGAWSEGDGKLARRWLLLASIHGYFSGSVETQIDGILRKLGDRPSIKRLAGATKAALKRLKPDDFDTTRLSGPAMSLYLSMLRELDARDWKDRNFKLDGTVTGHGAQLHIHHFFPKALLRKQVGLRTKDINTFANYTVISATTNLDVMTEEPGSYIPRLKIPDAELIKQCIPPDRALWRVDRYGDFIRERRRLLAEEANRFLNS